MKSKILLIVTLLAVCIIPSISHADESGEEKKKAPDPAEVFLKLDVDKSGSLNSEEVAGNKRLSKQFGKLDSDGNGELSLDEFKAGAVKKPKKPKAEKPEESEDEE